MKPVLISLSMRETIKVLKENDEEVIIEMPIMRKSVVNRRLTAGGGEGVRVVDESTFAAIVKNFPLYEYPVPVGATTHLPYSDRSGPSDGFVIGVRAEGENLIGKLWLKGELKKSVLDGSFRGFSVEYFHEGVELPTSKFDSAVLVGGIFTNRPAQPINFSLKSMIAASASLKDSDYASIDFEAGGKNVNLEALQAEIDALKAKAELDAKTIKDLIDSNARLQRIADDAATSGSRSAKDTASMRAEMLAAKAQVDDLEGKVEQLTTDLSDERKRSAKIQAELDKLTTATQLETVTKLRDEAIARGIQPKFFGDDFDANPTKFVQEKFGTVKAFEMFVASLEGVTFSKKKDDGDDTGKKRTVLNDNNGTVINPDVKKKLESLGLAGDFAGCDTAEQAAEIFRRKQQNSKQKEA